MHSAPISNSLNSVDALNHGCYCRTLNPDRLREQLESDASLSGLAQNIARTRPHLFSSTVVFLSRAMADAIAASIAAIERVIALPAYQNLVLAAAPAIAQRDFGPAGVFMGYDFHVTVGGPRLIEINTNAGGALLNAALARAQQACCESMNWAFTPNAELPKLEQTFCDMFAAEWQSQRGTAPVGPWAIVDTDPESQYLAPEFELFRQMFRHRQIDARIVDPKALVWHDGKLWHNGTAIEMIYNRLTDFYLTEPGHQALRSAHESDAVVLTPHPRAHALYADKRNLAVLSDSRLLATWGVSDSDARLLKAAIPQTRKVTPELADELWAQRRQLFFKPVASYGGKATYRGDKVTRRVWGEILAGDFVAQALVPPDERLIEVDGIRTELKFDVRAYTYAGTVQLLAARMYAGQTTNFRTPGGGFAPVVVTP